MDADDDHRMPRAAPADEVTGRRVVVTAGLAAMAAPSIGASPARAANEATVYVNGTILTMAGDTPGQVEAVAVRDGRIAFAGARDAALAAVSNPRLVDLRGRTMLPGFIDTWGHFTLFAQQTLGVNLAYFADRPPRSKADAIALLKDAAPFNGWVIGYGYDPALLQDGPLSLADLDAAFPDRPVMIATLSTLTGQVNSAGLAKLGLTPMTKAPPPGEIVKDPRTGKLTGELLFAPFLAAHAEAVGRLSQDQAIASFRRAEALLARQGYTTVQSYQLVPAEIAALRAAFDQDALALDVIGLPSISDAASASIVAQADWTWGAYSHGDRGLKIPGYQVATDAAPQLRLAAFTRPYLDTTGFPAGWKGMLLSRDVVEQWIGYAYAHDIQLFVYSNGDAGIDMSLAAIAKAIAATGKTGDLRTMVAHSYFVRPDQLAAYRAHDLGISMMPPHMKIYGETLLGYLGPERANLESPLASALKAGPHATLHCDCPSASPNVLEAIGGAVTRRTLAGRVMGAEEAVSPYAALLAATRNAARAYREEASKGTIEADKLADLVILDGNPLTVAPDRIRDIRVAETIKRGRTIHRSA